MAVWHFLASFNAHLAHRIVPLRVTSFLSAARRPAARTTATTNATTTDHVLCMGRSPARNLRSSADLRCRPNDGPEAFPLRIKPEPRADAGVDDHGSASHRGGDRR